VEIDVEESSPNRCSASSSESTSTDDFGSSFDDDDERRRRRLDVAEMVLGVIDKDDRNDS
jgi:hypothetical protein